jgi:hypothetical protein
VQTSSSEGKAMPGKSENGAVRRESDRRIAAWAAVVAFILLIPLVAMQFSDEWNWNLFDFAFAGTLLFGAALAYEWVAKKGGTTAYRAAVGVAVATALFLVWVNAAVGIIGDDESFNLMYFGVLATGIGGALTTRFRPQGMARAFLAVAIAQMLVPLIVLAIRRVQWGYLFSTHFSPCCGSDRRCCFGRRHCHKFPVPAGSNL